MLVCKASFPFTLPHVVHYTFFLLLIPRVFQTSDDELHGLYSIVVVVVMPQISNLVFFQNELEFLTVAPDKYFHQHSNSKRFLKILRCDGYEIRNKENTWLRR